MGVLSSDQWSGDEDDNDFSADEGTDPGDRFQRVEWKRTVKNLFT